MEILNALKNRIGKKTVAAGMAVGTVLSLSVASFAAEGDPGTLPTGTSDMFTKLAAGLIITIGAVAVIALGVYAAPQAIVVAKKIFKKVAA